MKRFKNYQTKIRTLSLLLGLVMVGIPVATSASTQNFNVLNNQAQLGMLMSSTNNTGVAEPATANNASSLLGVATSVDSTDITQKIKAGEIPIQTDGQTVALVSTLNGNIKVGDRITASSIVGIGAKVAKSSWIVGIAQGSLDSSTQNAAPTMITDSAGNAHQVYVASIPVVVKVTYYTVPPKTKSETKVIKESMFPTSIQSAADKLAGKHVADSVILLTIIICLAGVVVAGMVVSSAVRGGFAAIARQPLTKGIILRRVGQSFLLAFVLLALVVSASVLLLRLI